jgi:PTS system cellobiose-specific IIC component
MITLSVFYPILASIDMKNLAAFNSGHPAVSIVSMQFFFLCAFAGGAGNTLGLVLNMLTSKLPTNRALGKLALVPGIFGINEPIIFGMPIVMNPLIAVPFIFGPLLSTILGYIITKIGLIAMPTGISSITGAPIIVNQFLQGGWTWGVWTIVLIALSYVMYLPFFKAYEKTQLTQAKETQEATLNNVAKGFEDATK